MANPITSREVPRNWSNLFLGRCHGHWLHFHRAIFSWPYIPQKPGTRVFLMDISKYFNLLGVWLYLVGRDKGEDVDRATHIKGKRQVELLPNQAIQPLDLPEIEGTCSPKCLEAASAGKLLTRSPEASQRSVVFLLIYLFFKGQLQFIIYHRVKVKEAH